MSTQQDAPAVSSSSYRGVKSWLYNNYVHDMNAAAATTSGYPPPLLSRAKFDRIHLAPMIAGFASAAAIPRPPKVRSPSSESEAPSGAIRLSQHNDSDGDIPDEVFNPKGSLQFAYSECSSDDYYMIDSGAELGWYARVRGSSFCTAYEETRLENAALEGYNADVEDNADSLLSSERSSALEGYNANVEDNADSLLSSGRSLVSVELSGTSTTETTWSDSDSDSDFIASRIDNITAYQQSEMAHLKERAARTSQENSIAMPPPSKTMARNLESGPHGRAWTKQMDHTHARERQTAWACAAWAFREADDSKESYAVLKGKLNMLHDRQREAREALVKDIETACAYDSAVEVAG
jgi:hypothetical protein